MRTLQGSAWAMVGVTAVMLTVSGVFALMVDDREDELERMAKLLVPSEGNLPLVYEGTTKRDFEQYQKEGRRFETAAFVFLGLTGAAAITAATLFIVDHVTKKDEDKGEGKGDGKRARTRSLQIRPMLGERGAGLSVGWEF
jgi:hypothetical protein